MARTHDEPGMARVKEGRHIMIAGVGHPFLRDASVGPALLPNLQKLDWPEGVEIHDLHFGPIHVVQWLEEKPGYFSRVVLLSGVKRGRAPGEIYTYRWEGVLPSPEEIQQRVCEAVTGILGVDNLLIIAGHFRVWPDEVAVVEVEPCEDEWGADFSPSVQRVVPAVIQAVRTLALEPLDGLPADPWHREERLIEV